MKLFAIVDEHGNPSIAYPYKLMDGYHCIELHTYDPSKQGVYDKEKQVVVDRDVYNYVSSYAKFHSDPFSDKFLKAGEMK